MSLNNKNTSNKKTLDSKLDNDSSNSTSDLECLTTTNSCDSAISETEIANYKGIGFVPLVKPVVPQNQLVTKSNMDIVFPIIDEETKKKVIRNPKTLLNNYDNKLSQEDVMSLPALDYDSQQVLRDKYNELHQTIIDYGLYECDLWDYVREVTKLDPYFFILIILK